MLTRIIISNFKSIGGPENPAQTPLASDGGVDIEVKPLTLLVGPNGGGKSSILEAIVFWTQWLGVNIFPPLVPSLPQFQASFDDLVYCKRRDTEIVLQFRLDNGEWWRTLVKNGNVQVLKVTEAGQTLDEPQARQELREKVNEHIFFISASRGKLDLEVGPEVRAQWVGPLGEFVLIILNNLNWPEYHDQKTALTEWVQKLGVKDLWSGILPGRSGLTAFYRDLGTLFPVARASYGSRQLLPILANLIWSRPGSIHLIEEPEISLHPEHQVRILEFFAAMVDQKTNKRKIMATTHSHFLISALGIPVQQGLITSKDIAVYHVEKTEKGTVAKQLPITEDGYVEGGVPSFGPVEDRLIKEWAKTFKEN